MTEQLIIEESKHEALEEMYFWPAVREHLAAGDTLADAATEQEQAAKQVLAELDKLQAGEHAESRRLLAKIHHRRARAHRLRGDAGMARAAHRPESADKAAELGTKITEGKKTAPTRPHPHTPPSPGVLKAAGPAVAAADKARDAVTGRGAD